MGIIRGGRIHAINSIFDVGAIHESPAYRSKSKNALIHQIEKKMLSSMGGDVAT
jgi:hypothetical protein